MDVPEFRKGDNAMKIKRLLSLAVGAVLLLSMTASPVTAEDTDESPGDIPKGTVALEEGETIDLPLDADSAQERLDGMEKITENQNYAFYMDKTYLTVGIKSKKSGEILLSNPYSVAGHTISDEVKGEVFSQLELVYFNKKYESHTMNSWNDCVSKQQFTIRDTENGVAVDMIMGEPTSRLLLPRTIPAESFQKILDKVPESDMKKFTRMYKLYSRDTAVHDDQWNEWVKRYPVLEDMDIYALKECSSREKKELESIVKKTGYTFDDLDRDHQVTGYEGEDEMLASFQLTLQYTLTEDGLVAEVPAESIDFDRDGFYLNELTVLKYFGAGFSGDEDGYILLPDGSGALVGYTGSSSRSSTKLTLKLYGADFTDAETATYTPRQTEARLPIYGNRQEEAAFLAVVEEGAAMAKVTAQVGSALSPLNTGYATFTFTNKLQYVFDEANFDQNVTLFAKNEYKGTYKLLFMPVDKAAGYVGMAQSYRRYLIDKGDLASADVSGDIPLYLEILGAVETEERFLGFPVHKMTALTSFEDAENILTVLQENQISRTVLQYKGWANGGLDHTAFNRIKVEGALGGKKALRSLQEKAAEMGAQLFMDADFTSVQQDKWFDGFNAKNDAPRNLLKNIVGYSPLNLATSKYNNQIFTYLVSARKYESYMASMLKDFGKLSLDGLSMGNAGRFLYSDFKKKDVLDGAESLEMMKKALDMVPEDYTAMFEAGNGYVLPYADYLMQVSTMSNGYVLEDEDVPFYQIVISGKIAYGAESMNMLSDTRDQLLRCLESGSGISYTVAAANYQKLKATDHTEYYAVDFDNQLQNIVADYQAVKDAVGSSSQIVNHEILAKGVRRTTFASGKRVTVNYNTYAVTTGGVKIDAKGFVTDTAR